MLRKIRTVNGDSYYVTIPKYLIDTYGLKLGQYVDVTSKGSKIVVETKIKSKEEE